MKTLGEFLIAMQQEFRESTGEFSKIFHALRFASKVVIHEVNKAGLVDILGKVELFLYPQNAKSPQAKLRLLYECNPIAFIVQ